MNTISRRLARYINLTTASKQQKKNRKLEVKNVYCAWAVAFTTEYISGLQGSSAFIKVSGSPLSSNQLWPGEKYSEVQYSCKILYMKNILYHKKAERP